MKDRYDLSLVLACYNDAAYLEESFDDIIKILNIMNIRYEVIFVYDCGTDGTLSVIDKIIEKHGKSAPIKKVVHEKNEGRGKTVRDGFFAADGTIVGYIDVDLDVHPRYIPGMISPIINGDCDVATGFRFYRVYFNLFSVLRHILSHGYRFISRVILEEKLKDSESGYKFFKKDKVMDLVKLSVYNGWFWDTEIMCYCIYKGLKIREIPCVFERRSDKDSSVKIFQTVLQYFVSLVKFKAYLMKNKKNLFK